MPITKHVLFFKFTEKSNPPSLYEIMDANILKLKEIKVIKFGASHLGRYSITTFRQGDIHLLYIILSSVLLYLKLLNK